MLSPSPSAVETTTGAPNTECAHNAAPHRLAVPSGVATLNATLTQPNAFGQINDQSIPVNNALARMIDFTADQGPLLTTSEAADVSQAMRKVHLQNPKSRVLASALSVSASPLLKSAGCVGDASARMVLCLYDILDDLLAATNEGAEDALEAALVQWSCCLGAVLQPYYELSERNFSSRLLAFLMRSARHNQSPIHFYNDPRFGTVLRTILVHKNHNARENSYLIIYRMSLHATGRKALAKFIREYIPQQLCDVMINDFKFAIQTNNRFLVAKVVIALYAFVFFCQSRSHVYNTLARREMEDMLETLRDTPSLLIAEEAVGEKIDEVMQSLFRGMWQK